MEYLAGLVTSNYSLGNFSGLTKHRPIAAIPFGSRYRLVDFPFSNMVNSGITSVGLITPHLYRSIMDHIGSGKEFGLSRKAGGLFILPGSAYGYDLGLGKIPIKDLKGNMEFFGRDDFDRLVISACSKIYNIDYKEVEKFHIEKNANITLIYKRGIDADESEYVLDVDNSNRVKEFRRLKTKGKDVNLFIDSFIIDKSVVLKLLDWYRDNSYIDLLDAISENLTHLSVVAYEFKGYVKAINNVKEYMDASKELLNDKIIEELFMGKRSIYTKIHDASPVKYFDTAVVESSLIGTGSIIKGSVKNSILFRDAVIETGAKIENSVIMQKCYIGKDTIIENAIIEKGVRIEAGEVHKGTEEKPIIVSND